MNDAAAFDVVGLLLESSGTGAVLLDRMGRVSRHNAAIERLLARTDDALRGASVLDFVHARDRLRAAELFSSLVASPGARVRLEVGVVHPDGSDRHVELQFRNLLQERGIEGVLLHAREVAGTDEDRRLLHDALHDRLTGLVNRTMLLERIAQLIAEDSAARFVLLVVALEGLQLVHDNLDYRSGDTLLAQVTERLAASVRPQDTLARVGESEFAILIAGADEPAANLVVSRLRRALEKSFVLRGEEAFCSSSIGALVADGQYRSPEAALKDATLAASHARANGGERWAVFDGGMRDAVDGRLRLETELRRALERDELELHYQPIIRLETDELHAFEALVRWRHPEHGLLGPGRFLPLAEATGLIDPIGWWVLERACAQTSEWIAAGLAPVPVHVNVAATQLATDDLFGRVERALAEHTCPGPLLHLELTESMFAKRAEDTEAMLVALKQCGVGLSIDDFGTGYSSLSYLHRFPADALKIDRSFVSRLGSGDHEETLVRAIIHLGHDLGMRVVAEGVEHPSQVARLRQLGCDYGQGFHFSAPVPAHEALRMLERPHAPEAVASGGSQHRSPGRPEPGEGSTGIGTVPKNGTVHAVHS